MIDKCANPECDERLIYLRSGVLYAVDMHRASKDRRTTHFFWMCESCASRYRLDFNSLGEPELALVSMPTVRYDSETANCTVRSILINPPSRRTPETLIAAGSESRPTIPANPKIRKHRRVRHQHRVDQRVCA